MEFTSFIFGILATVATFTVISNLILLVKTTKLSKKQEMFVRDFGDEIEQVYKHVEAQHDRTLQTIDAEVRDIQSTINELAESTYTKSKTI